jgi:hypothetical protein
LEYKKIAHSYHFDHIIAFRAAIVKKKEVKGCPPGKGMTERVLQVPQKLRQLRYFVYSLVCGSIGQVGRAQMQAVRAPQLDGREAELVGGDKILHFVVRNIGRGIWGDMERIRERLEAAR